MTPGSRACLAAVLGLALLAAAHEARGQSLRELLASTPADSLVAPLRRLEARAPRDREAADAAFTLGQLHYARGEYRQAAEAYTRAVARLAPSRQGPARYWAGLAWLGAGEPAQARAALEEVARTDASLRARARFAAALAWESDRRPERALDELVRLADEGARDATPAALERIAILGERVGRGDLAARARTRLLRDWPSSLEASRLRGRPEPDDEPEAGQTGSAVVQIGAFSDLARARSLADAARRAGFPGALVASRREGAQRLHVVRLGTYPSVEEARRAGARAARALGVTYRVVKP
jgi:tetratricopeptide (TPR) repeat protein